MGLSVQGRLESPDATIDLSSNKNQVKVWAKPSNRLFDYLKQNVKFEKELRSTESIQIFSFQSLSIAEPNKFSSNQVCEVSGYKIKFKSPHETDGLSLLNVSTNTVHKVPIIVNQTNNKISFQIPNNLIAGFYKLSITSSCYGKSKSNQYSQSLECV